MPRRGSGCCRRPHASPWWMTPRSSPPISRSMSGPCAGACGMTAAPTSAAGRRTSGRPNRDATMIARRLLLGATLAAPAIARAQAVWPTRPVRVVVPFPPGGSNDVMARPLAERLQSRFGQPFVVENRGGASGSIGATAVAQAPADGHTLMVTSSSFATSAVLQKTTWDAERSFDAVAILARAPYYLLTNPDFPPRDVQALVAYAKARPGEVDYGSSGTGGLNHVVSEYFCQAAGIRMTHVPYKGTAQAVTDLMSGTIQLVITTVASANAPIREGRVRVIAP